MEKRNNGDPPKLVAKADRGGTLFGWKPRYDLRTIVADAWRWEQSESKRQ